jgi:poly(3-hydroxybutyrate) depolymerase
VNTQHSQIIVDAFRQIYGTASDQKFDLSQLDGANKNGQGVLYLKNDGSPQLSFIINNGIGHNWAAGGSPNAGTGAYVTQNSINYPMYLLSFFADLNRH